MELDGDLPYFLAFAMVGEPGMLQVTAYQHQFQLVNIFNVIANDPPGVFGVLNKIKLKFFVVMKREIELRFDAGEQRKAIALRKRGNFPQKAIFHTGAIGSFSRSNLYNKLHN